MEMASGLIPLESVGVHVQSHGNGYVFAARRAVIPYVLAALGAVKLTSNHNIWYHCPRQTHVNHKM